MIFPKSEIRNYLKVVLRLYEEVKFRKTVEIVTTFAIESFRGTLLYSLMKGKESILKLEILSHPVCISLEDEGLSQELFVYKIHEPFLTLLLMNEIKEGDVVVDIGANIGYYVMLECSLINGKGKVIAIEPDPRSRRILKMNTRMNCCDKNVEILNVAVGPAREKSTMLLSKLFNLSSVNSSVLRTREVVEEVSVDIVPLDELMVNEPKIDVIRMDVEGYEFQIVRGIIKTLKNFRPRFLALELHPIVDINLMLNLLETLANLNYEIKWAIPRQLIDGMLEVPSPLLKAALEVIQGNTSHTNLNVLPAETVPFKTFAEKFCSSNQVYHVIFAPAMQT